MYYFPMAWYKIDAIRESAVMTIKIRLSEGPLQSMPLGKAIHDMGANL
jgi:hypothetical protein